MEVASTKVTGVHGDSTTLLSLIDAVSKTADEIDDYKRARPLGPLAPSLTVFEHDLRVLLLDALHRIHQDLAEPMVDFSIRVDHLHRRPELTPKLGHSQEALRTHRRRDRLVLANAMCTRAARDVECVENIWIEYERETTHSPPTATLCGISLGVRSKPSGVAAIRATTRSFAENAQGLEKRLLRLRDAWTALFCELEQAGFSAEYVLAGSGEPWLRLQGLCRKLAFSASQVCNQIVEETTDTEPMLLAGRF